MVEPLNYALITALDPARPCFEGYDPQVRLDINDFEFLDVMHTNGQTLGFGFIKSAGKYFQFIFHKFKRCV